jgi:hypothetical protein
MRKLDNRNEKIKFLKSLHAGKTRISDLLPVRIEVWRVMDHGKTFIKIRTGERFSKKQHANYNKNQGVTQTITIPKK